MRILLTLLGFFFSAIILDGSSVYPGSPFWDTTAKIFGVLSLLWLVWIIWKAIKKVFQKTSTFLNRSTTSENNTVPQSIVAMADVGDSDDLEYNDQIQNLIDIGQSEKVLDIFERIENKLHERGLLTSLTGDSEADVSINLEMHDGGPHILVKIRCKEAVINEGEAETLQDYISEKIDDLIPETLDENEKNLFEHLWGYFIVVNGKVVY